MVKSKTEIINLTSEQAEQAERLNLNDGKEFSILGQVFIGDHPQAGSLYCYRLNRTQYDAIAKTIKSVLGID